MVTLTWTDFVPRCGKGVAHSLPLAAVIAEKIVVLTICLLLDAPLKPYLDIRAAAS